jgi:hypothetical protein
MTPTPPASPSASWDAAPARPTSPKAKPLLGWITVVGGLVLAVGSFLDSVRATAGSAQLGATFEQSYMDGDGPIVLGVGIVIVVLGALLALGVVPRWVGWIAATAGLFGVIIAIVDIVDVQDRLDRVEAIGGTGSIGAALWVCLVGGVIATAGGVIAAISNRAPE